MSGVTPTPSCAVNTVPNSQPLSVPFIRVEENSCLGICQVELITSALPILKSETALVRVMSYQCRLEMEFPNASGAPDPDALSILLPHVNEPCNCSPWVIRLVTPSSKAS